MKLLFATQNIHKLEEIRALTNDQIEILTPLDFNISEEIPETGLTLEENAKIKTQYIFSRCQMNCFADDSGLEIEALNGKPGVFSARYAGAQRNNDDNIDLVLSEMFKVENRKACFKTVIVLLYENKYYQFIGKCDGEILQNRAGVKGFGYDSIFKPDGFNCSFAEMSAAQKNSISHRGIAFNLLIDFLLKKLK